MGWRAALTFVILASVAPLPSAAAILEEHVTGGVLDLPWLNGFGVSANLQPLTLVSGDPALPNPSGDGTVGVATNSAAPDSGGVVLSGVDPGNISDYAWEAWVFTGAGNTRRGLVVRADPTNQFQTCYQFVVQSGLLQFNFRKLVNSAPTTLGTWFSNSFPGGQPLPNTWHHMRVVAIGDQFRCYWDGYELTQTGPIVDSSIATGWVGVYNFRFDLGGVPFYVDDLVLEDISATPTKRTSWGQVKDIYAR
jgi:hypothetical protein